MVVVGSEDDKHKVPLKNKYVAIIFLCFCVSLSQVVLSSNCEMVKSARHERVKQNCPLLPFLGGLSDYELYKLFRLLVGFHQISWYIILKSELDSISSPPPPTFSI